LESARLQLESARQSIVVAEEGTKLDLELGAGLNGSLLENDFGYPAPPPIAYPNLQDYSVGLSLNVPFDIFTSRWDASLKTGRLNVAQQEVLFQSAQNSDSQQWEDMTIRYNKSEDRIATATQLMEKSKQKRDQGRDLLKKGRVDLFEELSFVNAYVSSVGVRQTWIAQRLSLLAQADWYRAGPGDGAAK
jgi:outer membrane protein TolC